MQHACCEHNSKLPVTIAVAAPGSAHLVLRQAWLPARCMLLVVQVSTQRPAHRDSSEIVHIEQCTRKQPLCLAAPSSLSSMLVHWRSGAACDCSGCCVTLTYAVSLIWSMQAPRRSCFPRSEIQEGSKLRELNITRAAGNTPQHVRSADGRVKYRDRER